LSVEAGVIPRFKRACVALFAPVPPCAMETNVVI
jgi:hypothetical protein